MTSIWSIKPIMYIGGDRYDRFHGCDLALPFGGQPGEAREIVRGDLLSDRSLRKDDHLSLGKDEVPQGLPN